MLLPLSRGKGHRGSWRPAGGGECRYGLLLLVLTARELLLLQSVTVRELLLLQLLTYECYYYCSCLPYECYYCAVILLQHRLLRYETPPEERRPTARPGAPHGQSPRLPLATAGAPQATGARHRFLCCFPCCFLCFFLSPPRCRRVRAAGVARCYVSQSTRRGAGAGSFPPPGRGGGAHGYGAQAVRQKSPISPIKSELY